MYLFLQSVVFTHTCHYIIFACLQLVGDFIDILAMEELPLHSQWKTWAPKVIAYCKNERGGRRHGLSREFRETVNVEDSMLHVLQLLMA